MAQVLGPIFLDMERNAACWQRMRDFSSCQFRSASLSSYRKKPEPWISARMVESFQLGIRDLQEIWGLVLPPSTLFELRKLVAYVAGAVSYARRIVGSHCL